MVESIAKFFHMRTERMAISFRITVEGDTLMVVAWGFDESLEDAKAYGGAVIEAAIEHKVKRVLCDELELEYRLAPWIRIYTRSILPTPLRALPGWPSFVSESTFPTRASGRTWRSTAGSP